LTTRSWPAGSAALASGRAGWSRRRRGLRPDDPLPLDPAGLAADQLVAEIIMQPAKTPLLILG
jgi:hypothetical protein